MAPPLLVSIRIISDPLQKIIISFTLPSFFIVDLVLPKKGESLVEAYDKWRAWADPKVCCDYSFHIGLTWWSKSVSDEMKIMCEELGINSFKMYMAYKGICQLNDSEMLDAFERIRALGALAQVFEISVFL